MPAAAAEAPVGNHHVLATKKYALTKVISQITMRRTRPIWRDLPRRILGQPHYGNAKNPWDHSSWGRKRGESTTAYSARKQVVAFYIFCFGTPKSHGCAGWRRTLQPRRDACQASLEMSPSF